jgi:hypothetical protein
MYTAVAFLVLREEARPHRRKLGGSRKLLGSLSLVGTGKKRGPNPKRIWPITKGGILESLDTFIIPTIIKK